MLEYTKLKNYNTEFQGFDVGKDGSYKCEYINGYRLDKILKKDMTNQQMIEGSKIENYMYVKKNKYFLVN